MSWKFPGTSIEIHGEIVRNQSGSRVGIRREFIGINGEEVRNLRGIRGDLYGITRELVGGITGEFV